MRVRQRQQTPTFHENIPLVDRERLLLARECSRSQSPTFSSLAPVLTNSWNASGVISVDSQKKWAWPQDW
jgi:hypothetical protein